MSQHLGQYHTSWLPILPNTLEEGQGSGGDCPVKVVEYLEPCPGRHHLTVSERRGGPVFPTTLVKEIAELWLGGGRGKRQAAVMRYHSPSCTLQVLVTLHCHQRKFTPLPLVTLQPRFICSVTTHNSLCPKPASLFIAIAVAPFLLCL